MKKLVLSSLLFVVAFVLTNCKPNEANPATVYTDGILILNEGNFTAKNGNIAFYKNSTREITPDVVKTANGNVGINATVQKTFDDKINDKLYVVTNAPDQLLVFQGKTLKNEVTISTGLQNPFGVAVANGKAFVSEWGATFSTNYTYVDAAIKVVNLSTKQIATTIPVGKEVNGMLEYNGKIYVAVTGSDEVWVINSSTSAVETKIITSVEPISLEVDANNKIWVLCSSGNLNRINPANNTVETTVSNLSVGYGGKMTMDSNRQNIYWIGSGGQHIYRLGITATFAPISPLITIPANATTNVFYGLGVKDNQIAIGLTNYSAVQKILFYDTNGIFGNEYPANGYLTNGFLYR